jgi:transposase
MAHVADHLSIEELEKRYRSCADACSARHYQTIWLLAQGHTVAEVAELTCFVPRWIEELQARYNALGPQTLGDLRRNNGSAPSVLKPEILAKLKDRLQKPPPDGGVWTSRKVADFMADQLGLDKLAPQRGWEALRAIGWSIQSPRPKNPNSASAEEAAAFKKKACRHGRARGQRTSRSAGGSLGDGRTSDRPEADPSPGLGPDRRTSPCARPPPL